MRTEGKRNSSERRAGVLVLMLLCGTRAAAQPITNGMPADNVLGQPGFTTNTSGAANMSSNGQSLVVRDGPNKYLLVADNANMRVLIFDITAGLVNGAAPWRVLGQPDFATTTRNTACGGGSSGATNPCGMYRPYYLAFDTANRRLFVSDSFNTRVLVFDLSAGFTSITNGMAATSALGQTSLSSWSASPPCSGYSTTVTPCRIFTPDGLSYDQATQRLFVASNSDHRILVFDLSAGITNGMAASWVLGQPNFTTNSSNTACGGGSSGTVNPCGVFVPTHLLYDPVNRRLFVAEYAGNNRISVFDLSAGITNGMAASWVLGQPNLTTGTANTACGGGGSGTVNPCGLKWVVGLSLDQASGRFYVADAFNNRVLVFSLSGGITNGMAASWVLGQPNFTTATANTQNAAFGCTTTVNSCGFDFSSFAIFDATDKLLYVSDQRNRRVLTFFPNMEGASVTASASVASVITTTNADASKTFALTGSTGDQFAVTLPAGTDPLAGQGSIDFQVVSNLNKPSIKVSAQLPAGTTKTVSIPRGTGNTLCVKDQPGAQIGGGCVKTYQVPIPAAGTSCTAPNASCQKLASGQSISTNGANTSVTVTGLLNTVLDVVNDADSDGVLDESDHCPGTDLAGPVPTVTLRSGHMPDSAEIYGCNPSQIFQCKPGQNEGERKFGLTPGSQSVFISKTSSSPLGWAEQCNQQYPNP